MFIVWLVTAWGAETADLLGPRDAVAYGGLGLSTWAVGMSGQPRDRAYIARADLYAALGLHERLELAASVPVVHSRVADDAGAPCPSPVDYCDAVTSLGAARLQAKSRVDAGPVRIAPSLGLWADPWNAATRTRYINVGQGTWGLDPGLTAGLRGDDGLTPELVLVARYHYVHGRPVAGGYRAPSDAVSEALQLSIQPGPVRLGLAARHFQRLWGEDYTPDYVRAYFGTEERWGVVRFGEVRIEPQVSWSISDTTGLHLSASRVVWTINGPPDHTDISLGIHHWFDG